MSLGYARSFRIWEYFPISYISLLANCRVDIADIAIHRTINEIVHFLKIGLDQFSSYQLVNTRDASHALRRQ